MALGTQSWLNMDFVEGILRKSEGDNSIHVIDIFSKPATSVGDNYTSDMTRVAVEFSRKQGKSKTTEKKSIIVKVAPTLDGMKKDLITKADIFNTEMSMMTNTLKKMNSELGPGQPLNGEILYIQKDDPPLLVIEDLAPLGFRMADREAGLDLAHCLLALRGLARFHASSVAVCEKDPKQKDLYYKGIFNNEHPVEMSAFFVAGTKTLASEVENWPELGRRYSEKISNLAEKLYQKGTDAAARRDDEFNVINHGDFWVNNMMFRYGEDGKPVDHIFVDFQMCVYTSPAIDLLYFMNTSPSEEIWENSKDMLLDHYLHNLTMTMKQLGCKTQPPTMDELKRSMKERAAFGMASAFTILPFVLIDKKDATDLSEILQQDGTYTHPGYKSRAFRRAISKRIPMYDEMGLLD